jgi:hypothetical protein
MKWHRNKKMAFTDFAVRNKKTTVTGFAVRIIGGLATAGLIYVAFQSAPDVIRYWRMRRM